MSSRTTDIQYILKYAHGFNFNRECGIEVLKLLKDKAKVVECRDGCRINLDLLDDLTIEQVKATIVMNSIIEDTNRI